MKVNNEDIRMTPLTFFWYLNNIKLVSYLTLVFLLLTRVVNFHWVCRCVEVVSTSSDKQ